MKTLQTLRPLAAPAPVAVLQRCACGRSPGPTGECAECRRKRPLGLQPKLRVGVPGDRYEREADRVAEAVVRSGPAPAPLPITPLVQQRGARAIQRQPSPDAAGPPTVGEAAARAEIACDLAALCRLHFSNPEAVTEERVRTAARQCRPGVFFSGSPCLNLTLLDPSYGLPGPAATPGKATPGGAPPAAPASGLPSFSEYTKLEFSLGGATVTVDLPSSATAKLPVAFRGAYKITFELAAKASGAFSFSITLDGVPHVQIKAGATLDASKKSITGELSISSTKKTCQAPSPQATKDALQKAGDKLVKAIEDYGKPFEPNTDEEFERTKRLAEVVSGIAGMHQAVEKAKEKCKPTSSISFGITGQAPLDPRAEGAGPATITFGPTFRF